MKLRRIQFGIWWSDGRSRPSRRARTPGSPPARIKIAKHCAVSMALSMALALSAMHGQVVDRVVAKVNGHAILQSDWEQEVAFEAVSNARDPDSFTAAERSAALDRLIDQELLREQVRPSQPAPAAEIALRAAEVRKLQPDCATDEEWRAKLQRYGLTQSALEKDLGRPEQTHVENDT